MKTGILYLFAMIFAVAVAFVFSSSSALFGVFETISIMSIKISVVVSLIFAGITIMGSVAALRRVKHFGLIVPRMVLWVIISAVIFAGLAFASNYVFRFSFSPSLNDRIIEIMDTLEYSGFLGISESHLKYSDFFGLLSSVNPFVILAIVVFLSYIVGIYLKPDIEVIRPAYVVMNSFNEVGYRFADSWSKIMVVFMFFISSSWYGMLINRKYGTFQGMIIMDDLMFFLVPVAIVFAGIVLLTIIAAVFSRGQSTSALSILFNSLSAAIVALLSSNTYVAYNILGISLRKNTETPKKNISVELPFFMLFCKVTAGVFAYLLAMAAIKTAVPREELTIMNQAVLLAVAVGISCISGLKLGNEVVWIAMFLLTFQGINSTLAYAFVGMVGPLMNSLAAFSDTIVSALGVAANQTDTSGIMVS